MKIKYQFTFIYVLTFLIIILLALFFDRKTEDSEVFGGIFYGTLLIAIIGIIFSLIIEITIRLFNKKIKEIVRFILMFVILDLVFFCVSRFELVSSLLEVKGQQFDIALPVVGIHLICYSIAFIASFIFQRFKKANL